MEIIATFLLAVGETGFVEEWLVADRALGLLVDWFAGCERGRGELLVGERGVLPCCARVGFPFCFFKGDYHSIS